MIADMQFIMVSSLISVSINGIGKRIQSVMLSFIMLDVLQSDLWFTQHVSSPNSKALSPTFEENGYDSINIFDNLGSTFIFGMILLTLYVVYLLLLATKEGLKVKHK